MSEVLRRLEMGELGALQRGAVDAGALRDAAVIVEDVRSEGESALRAHAWRLDDLDQGQPLSLGRDDLRLAFSTLDQTSRDLLSRAHDRIRAFSRAQRETLSDLDMQIQGGRAGHRWIPVDSVGAYAPGGRYPLPSSVLMTVTPARMAGVDSVWVASPRPSPLTLGAAWVAGADGLLPVGGAQAIAALAFGTVSPASQMVVGPGNKWVTAAKRYLCGEIGIDGFAGPSEIVVVADDGADPMLVAADLLAQAEHDADALPGLIAMSETMASCVEDSLRSQLEDLPTAGVAGAALENAFCVVVDSLSRAADVVEAFAPEHLSLHLDDPARFASSVRSYGSVFIGSDSAETFADYGAGPNHVLPTGGGARYSAGLSVFTFLKAATWLSIDDPSALVEDTTLLARSEGLEAHARAALVRMQTR